MRRTVTALFTLLIAVMLSGSIAMAANPHFISQSGSGPNNAGQIVVKFKIAGLGDNQAITVVVSGDAAAVYACRNNGGNFPADSKKTEVDGPVSASGDFTSGQNGQVSGSLTLSPPTTTLNCPGGQRQVLVSVTYTNVQISATGVGTVALGLACSRGSTSPSELADQSTQPGARNRMRAAGHAPGFVWA